MRICSLLPSATEIVGALGLTSSLVGVSEECDWPPEVRGLPVVTASRIDPNALTGAEIDRAVRTAVADGTSLYAIDAELIESLAPDVVVTQDLCRVCAVPSDQLDVVSAVDVDVVSLDPHTIAEIGESVLELAGRLGEPARGREVVAEMEHKLAQTSRAVAGAPRRRVFFAEWLDPPFAAGHWLPEMVELAGGRDVLGQAGAPSRPTSWEAALAEGPELVVVAPCGFDHERAAGEARLPPLPCRAVAVDAGSYYSRPAPRVADGVRQLAHLLHPELAPDPGLPQLEVA
jgi:iron complex transport system substrate-binding protein